MVQPAPAVEPTEAVLAEDPATDSRVERPSAAARLPVASSARGPLRAAGERQPGLLGLAAARPVAPRQAVVPVLVVAFARRPGTAKPEQPALPASAGGVVRPG